MDFKFKEVVEESIIYFYDHVLSCNEYTEDVFEELDHVYAQAAKSNEYEAKNKKLLEELKYLNKVNDDLAWQRDTDEEHEAKAKAFDQTKETLKEDVEKLEKLEKDFPLSCQGELEQLNNILVLMTRNESGEYDAKK